MHPTFSNVVTIRCGSCNVSFNHYLNCSIFTCFVHLHTYEDLWTDSLIGIIFHSKMLKNNTAYVRKKLKIFILSNKYQQINITLLNNLDEIYGRTYIAIIN